MADPSNEPNLAAVGDGEVRFLIGDLLRGVSRSFYLTLRVLPRPLYRPVGLAYLMARAADTIADTPLLSVDARLGHLLAFRGLFTPAPSISTISSIQDAIVRNQQVSAERVLLQNIDRCFALWLSLEPRDRDLVAEVLRILTTGMEKDLRRFPPACPAEVKSLQTPEELDEYTYLVAGCVGPFWTKISHAHLPSLAGWDVDKSCELGIRFGKALQLTNILRDLPRDLAGGRCYLPAAQLSELGLQPAELRDPGKAGVVLPLYRRWLDTAVDHYQAAWQYTLSIPKREGRLRLACVWPIWIGLKTLALLRDSTDFLNPARVIKITRNQIYGIMAESSIKIGSDRLLSRRFERLMAEAA